MSDFLEDIEELREQQKKRLEEVYINAENRAGYSQYEFRNSVESQALKDICMEYRSVCGKDPALIKILDKVEKYASLNAHAANNYVDERALLSEIMSDLDRYADVVIAQQNKIAEEIANSPYDEKTDKELYVKEEFVENRLRIHGSLTSYFASLTRGNLVTPMDKYFDPEKDKKEIDGIKDADSMPLKRYDNKEYSYINGVGADILYQYRSEKLRKNNPMMQKATSVSKADKVPIFPHEPRLNDIEQGSLGDCYVLSPLQDLARLYPEKIKDMIRDNGDGTATVRFFEKIEDKKKNRKKKDNKEKYKYRPLYVRVDKKEAYTRMLGTPGAQNCFWASLIERAYMISGLRLSKNSGSAAPDIEKLKRKYDDFKLVEPLSAENFNELKTKYPWLLDSDNKLTEWRPSIGSIESGHANEFLENCLGAEGKSEQLYNKSTYDETKAGNGDLLSFQEQLFQDVYEALKKGFPVTAGSIKGSKDVQESHAYSVIGAYKTDDTPPKMYFRMRNPWGAHTEDKGVEFEQDENGSPVARRISSKEGIFDIEIGKFTDNFSNVFSNGSAQLQLTPHNTTKTFEFEKLEKNGFYKDDTVDPEMYTSYAKYAHDIYDALRDTNGIFTRDSEAYLMLMHESRSFIDTVMTSRGKNIMNIDKALDTLVKRADLYLAHVAEKDVPGRRQIKRSKVCRTIKLLKENGLRAPGEKMEKDFAEKLVSLYYKNRKMKITPENQAQFESDVQKMTENRAFREITGKMNINKMIHADEKLLNSTLKDFQKKIQGRGVEKIYDPETQKSVRFTKSV